MKKSEESEASNGPIYTTTTTTTAAASSSSSSSHYFYYHIHHPFYYYYYHIPSPPITTALPPKLMPRHCPRPSSRGIPHQTDPTAARPRKKLTRCFPWFGGPVRWFSRQPEQHQHCNMIIIMYYY